MIAVSVLIVSYRTRELTLRAVTSALASGPDVEVVVVDNASGDGTVESLHALKEDRLRVEARASNDGYGVAANHATRLSSGEILVFLNSDAELPSDALSQLTADVRARRVRCVVAPRLVSLDGHVQLSAGLRPAPFDLAVRALGLARLRAIVDRVPLVSSMVRRSRLASEYRSAAEATEPMETSMVSFACAAMGRDAFAEVGGFDERFFLYFEDADVCRRAADAGMPIRYLPSAVVTHAGGASTVGDYHYTPMHARSMRQYLEKWWGSPGAALAILLLWLRLIGHALILHPGTGKAFAALRAAFRP